MNIPKETIKAAEKAFKEELRSQGLPLVASWKREISAAIEAAMPHIRKQIAEEVRSFQVWKAPNIIDPLPEDYVLMGQLEMRDRAAYQIEGADR